MFKKIFSVFLTAALVIGSFSAVSAAQTYSLDSAQALISGMNIMTGDENGNMNLDSYVTRAEFAKIAVNSSKYKNSVALGASISVFKDCTYTHWSAPYVKVAVTNGMLTGYPDGTFRPENTVLYEEAVTVLLRLLGYEDDDFGSSWPYGQVSLAANISLNKNVSAGTGDALTRSDVLTLVYNTLRANPKDSDKEYITQLDATYYEDAVIMATNREDTSVSANYVLTSAGTFKMNDSFDYSYVGMKGDLAVKSNGEMIAFMPNSQTNSKYVVYSTLENSVVAYKDGQLTELDLSDNTTVYKGSETYTFANAKSLMSMGDVIYAVMDSNGSIEYLTLTTDTMEGPVTLTSYSDTWYTVFTPSADSLTVMRDGVRTSISGLKSYDVLYYSEDLNTVFAYSKKVTGIYEKASPNKDTPQTVVVSGTEYTIESVEAFNKLSSNGSINYGDTVTLLFGKDGEIADVINASDTSSSSSSTAGYVVETGSKSFTDANDESYTSKYVNIVYADGTETQYAVSKDYSSFLNNVMNVSFSDGSVKLSKITASFDVSGTVSASKMKIGSDEVADDVKILDVSTTDKDHTGNAVSTYMSRIDGISLSSSSVLWCKTNDDGEISELILKDVTGDSCKYGIVTSAADSGSYTVDIDGEKSTYSGGYYSNINTGTPVKAEFSDGKISSLSSLKVLRTVSSVDDTTLTASKKTYKLSDKLVIYQKASNSTYNILARSSLGDLSDYTYVKAYYDKDESRGGRIRIIVVE